MRKFKARGRVVFEIDNKPIKKNSFIRILKGSLSIDDDKKKSKYFIVLITL